MFDVISQSCKCLFVFSIMDLKLSNQECIREPTVAVWGKNEFCQGVYFQMFVVAQMCSNNSAELEGFLAVKSWWNPFLTTDEGLHQAKGGKILLH